MDAQEYFNNLRIRQLLESEAANLAAKRIQIEPLEKLRTRIQAIAASSTPDRSEIRALDEALHALIQTDSGNALLGSSWRASYKPKSSISRAYLSGCRTPARNIFASLRRFADTTHKLPARPCTSIWRTYTKASSIT